MNTSANNQIDLNLGTTLIHLRGQIVRVYYSIGSGEPEINNGEDFVDHYWLTERKTGERLNWDLTDQEDQQVIDLTLATREDDEGFRAHEDEDEPRRSWSRRNPTAPTGTGRR